MPTRLIHWVARHPVWTAVVLAGFGISLHVVQEFVPNDSPALVLRLSSLLRVLGDLVIVAALAGVFVEFLLTHALIRNVWWFIIGHALPPEIRDRIREVSQTSIVRKNYRADYSLRPNSDGNGLTVRIDLFYEVFNYGIGPMKYPPKLAVDFQDNPTKDATRCEVTEPGKNPICWESEDWKKGKRAERRVVESDEAITWNGPEVQLPPQELTNAQPGCTVTWRYEMEMPNEYSDILFFFWPTIGVRIKADCPGLVFSCDGCPPTGHDARSDQWVYTRLFMPGELVRVRWKKRPTPSALSAG
jgi:hypothetical protein